MDIEKFWNRLKEKAEKRNMEYMKKDDVEIVSGEKEFYIKCKAGDLKNEM